MQIQGDYHSYSGQNYDREHTHHITRCLYEEKKEQPVGGTAGVGRDTFMPERVAKALEEPEIFYRNLSVTSEKKEKGLFRGFWNALGEDASSVENAAKAAPAASSGFRQMISDQVIGRLGQIREKIRVSISAALKRFRRGSEAFSMLSDPKENRAGKDRGKQKHPQEQEGTRMQEDPIPAAYLSEGYLMDSYSRTGAYCQLNENMTYQKKDVSAFSGERHSWKDGNRS